LIYRWIYNIWRFFWKTVIITTALILSLLLIGLGVVQLPQSKSYLKTQIENTFNNQFEGSLYLHSIEGFIPFQIQIKGGQFYASGELSHPVVSFENAILSVSWWDLLQKNLSIRYFELHEPAIHLNKVNGELNLAKTFKQRESDVPAITDEELPLHERVRIFDEIDLYAPRLSIINGTLLTGDEIELPDDLQLPSPLIVQHLNTDLLLEISDSQLFLDITGFSAVLPNTPYEFVRATGQFYNDDRFFEINALNIATAQNRIVLNLDADPVSIFHPTASFADQIQESQFRLDLNQGTLSNPFVRHYIPQFPESDEDIQFELRAEGTLDELWIDRFQASIGESSVIATAGLTNLLNNRFAYQAQIENVVLQPEQFQAVSNTYLNAADTGIYQNAIIRGNLQGNLQEIDTDLSFETNAGSAYADLYINFNSGNHFEFLAEADSLDISPFLHDTTDVTRLNGRLVAEGDGFRNDSSIRGSIDFSDSRLKGHPLTKLVSEFRFHQSNLSYSLLAEDDVAVLEARGDYYHSGENSAITTQGSVRNLNTTLYTELIDTDYTDLSGTFSASIENFQPDRMHGRISIEMEPSVIGGDTLRAHQLYADLSPPDNALRQLRFTSSFIDGELEGTIVPGRLQKLASYWGRFLEDRIRREFLFDSDFDLGDFTVTSDDIGDEQAELSLQLLVKDIDLLRYYISELPEFESRSRITANISADRDRLSLSGNLFDEELNLGRVSASNLNSSISAEFNYTESIRDFGVVDAQVNSESFQWNNRGYTESYLNLSVRNDSLQVNQYVKRDDEISLESAASGALREGSLELLIDRFTIGSPDYNWQTLGTAELLYSSDRKLSVSNLKLASEDDLLEIDGTFSDSIEDSVNFKVDNFDLRRISDMIGGRIEFSGILNGEFITRTLGQIPSIQGDLLVSNGRIDDRVIGDVSLNSEFNSDRNRFDTSIRVYTNPDNYGSYLNRNEGIGQDLRFDGYFRLPDDQLSDEDDLFYFDADLQEVDLWIVTFIVPNVIADMEGRASGTGFIHGNLTDFDFESDFEITDTKGTPFFTNVEYDIEGSLRFTKTEGVVFNDLYLTDHRGGRGTLTGDIDLNEFRDGTYLNLTLDLNELQFMNNPYDPDVPFYASLYGTGQAQITGPNTSPFLRTTTPIALSSNSRVSIPLEEETEFEQDRRFIQFVDTFDLALLQDRLQQMRDENGNGEDPEELTFVELFTMDLQFAANNPVNVQLIFDPVTNEILNANGTGQVRILLEDQDVSMFGRFNIQSGEYQFVSGDIFTRRFTLQEGGAISWQGDMIDANLDVTAVYRARPVISTLLASGSGTATPDAGQRIPIELVLQIGGTITQVENEFYFRVPTGIEGTLDPTLATQINNLNQNEEEKLIQATSILLSGNFIPSAQAQGLGMGLGEGLSGTAAVVNPLLSSQVINPLLSNQINSLLRSDITFDIDLNLTAFNEVDLGVALRLFDDRVILRREGQITGEQSDIGDLGATYRINRTFSLTAFHRQDPTLSYTSNVETRQTQEMNGVGIEAQLQFNTWQQFGQRISNAFRSLFGLDRRESDEPESGEVAEMETIGKIEE
jgi:hypothetical protein